LNTASHYQKIVCIDGQLIYLSGMKVLNREGKIEFVIVASFSPDPLALTKYKDRWQTETMFKAYSLFKFGLMFIAHALLNPSSIKDRMSSIQIFSCA